MAHHKSAKKRIRQTAVRRERNRYKLVGMRLAIKDLRNTTEKTAAEEKLPQVVSLIDRVEKSNIIHKNKASNIKGKLTKYVNSL